MESLLHRDPTHRDIWLKLILAIPIIVILIPALLYLAGNDRRTAYEMLAIVAVIAIVMWLIIPRQYLILEDRLKIVLGGPFSFSIPFKNIKTARIPKGTTLGVNFPSSLSSKHVVEIVRNGRLSVTITPNDRDLFLKTLEKGLNDWKIYQNRGVR
jgi:hypothetical protein